MIWLRITSKFHSKLSKETSDGTYLFSFSRLSAQYHLIVISAGIWNAPRAASTEYKLTLVFCARCSIEPLSGNSLLVGNLERTAHNLFLFRLRTW